MIVSDLGTGGDPIPSAPLRGLPVSEQTLPALLQRQADVYGEKVLVRCGAVERSYAEMPRSVARAAGRLAAAGVAGGDRVAIMAENRTEELDLFLGCSWLGATAVPINTAARGEQLGHVLRNCGARLMAVDSDLIGALAHVPRCPALEAVWALDGVPDHLPAGFRVTAAPSLDGEELAPAAVAPADTAAILYTSGTTGAAKGVCCPQAQLYWFGILVAEKLGMRESDVLHTTLPLFHINALSAFVQALVSGATFVLGPRFSVSRFWPRVIDAQATITYLLGTMVGRLLTLAPSDYDRGHRVRVALAPGTPSGAARAFEQRFGVPLVDGYASTETNSVMATVPGSARGGRMGFLRRGFTARVVDENDEPLPDGTAGELVLRADAPYSFSTGYFGMPEKTAETWRNLWFHTGDRVVRDADGWFRFVDRIKDSLRRGGENISAHEVEQALLSHPDVAAAAVFPITGHDGEDEVAAAIIVRPGRALGPRQLIKHCEPRLAYFAIPRYLEIVDEFPLTETGKVRKSSLRERGVSDSTWDRVANGYELRRRP